MLKKGKDKKIVMMYMDYTNEFPLPNRRLGLYAVDTFIFNLQRKKEELCRSASARITCNPNPQYHGEDSAPEGPAYTSYAGFDEAGLSLVHHPGHVGWEQPSSHHSEGSWQQGSS
jgi:hypothetical protein